MPLRRRVHEGTELTSTATTLLTFSDNLVEGGAVLAQATIANRSGSRRRVTIHFVVSGGSPAESNCIFEEYVPPNRTVTCPGGPWWMNSGAFVSAICDAVDPDVAVRITAFEEYLQGTA